MSGKPNSRKGLAAAAGALVAGALVAVLVSSAGAGSGPRMITFKAGPERLLEIVGSNGADSLSIQGASPGSVTIVANRAIANQRTDCDVSPVPHTSAFCADDDLRVIDTNLRKGPDDYGFSDNFSLEPEGTKLIGRGGKGADDLVGSEFEDRLKGNAGRDSLDGNDGNDRLDGGPDRDECDGGPGKNQLRRCE